MEWTDLVTDRSARGIAATIGRLISSGHLEVGERLPTVRTLAGELHVSPATVAEAWQILLQAGLIETRRRGGTMVRARTAVGRPSRFAQIHPENPPAAFDLSTGAPDPTLLPDLNRALRSVDCSAAARSYFDPPLVAGLEEALRTQWPYPPEALTILDGALDALDRVFAATLHLGDRVLVESTTFAPILDLLEEHGAEPVAVSLDTTGLDPQALRAAVASVQPRMLVLQPRAHNPTGAAMTAQRAAECAAVLQDTDILVVEDDHAGAISTAAPASLGTHCPERCVTVRSFSKSHGPDLRLAALGGPREIVARVNRRRVLGPIWSSRLLQLVLAQLLADPDTRGEVDRARQRYAERRQWLVTALGEAGVTASAPDGFNVWVRVRDERHCMLHLAMRGVAVAPGSVFAANSDASTTEHIRVTCSTLAVGTDSVAANIAEAAVASGQPRNGW